jgi:hypothetical protein
VSERTVVYVAIGCTLGSISYLGGGIGPNSGQTNIPAGQFANQMNGTTLEGSFTFMVPPNWYYQVTQSGNVAPFPVINFWTEWY